jgi:hypothetical protein
MFITELSPLFKEFAQHPVSFLGGFVSGVLRLNLAEEPVKSWLNQKPGCNRSQTSTSESTNGKSSGPQQIMID